MHRSVPFRFAHFPFLSISYTTGHAVAPASIYKYTASPLCTLLAAGGNSGCIKLVGTVWLAVTGLGIGPRDLTDLGWTFPTYLPIRLGIPDFNKGFYLNRYSLSGYIF
ncbi:hypothetical protein BDV19DRAFT_214268 [Aspergillus venezuelensis]